MKEDFKIFITVEVAGRHLPEPTNELDVALNLQK